MQPRGPNLFSLLKPYRTLIFLLAVMTLLGNSLNLLVPKLISWGIDAYGQQRLVLPTFIAEFLAVAAGIFIFAYLQAIVQTYASERVARDLRTRIVAKKFPVRITGSFNKRRRRSCSPTSPRMSTPSRCSSRRRSLRSSPRFF